MSHGNPHDPSYGKEAGPSKAHPSTTYTHKEQEDLLHNYIAIPDDFIENIRYGTHIRYIRKSGEFRVGGYVARNPMTSREGKKFIVLRSSLYAKSPNTAEWTLAYDDILTVYALMDAVSLTIQRNSEEAFKTVNRNQFKMKRAINEIQNLLEKR